MILRIIMQRRFRLFAIGFLLFFNCLSGCRQQTARSNALSEYDKAVLLGVQYAITELAPQTANGSTVAIKTDARMFKLLVENIESNVKIISADQVRGSGPFHDAISGDAIVMIDLRSVVQSGGVRLEVVKAVSSLGGFCWEIRIEKVKEKWVIQEVQRSGVI